MNSSCQRQIKDVQSAHNELLQRKSKELATKYKETETATLKRFEEKIKKYEKDWIPVIKHEEIVNSELEKLEADYQEQLTSAYSQAVKQVDFAISI